MHYGLRKGNLIKIAKKKDIRRLLYTVRRRWKISRLTPVGLLPAAMCGIDIDMLLDGAAYMDELSKMRIFIKSVVYVLLF